MKTARELIEDALAWGPTEVTWCAVGRIVENEDDELPDICAAMDRAAFPDTDSDKQQRIDCSYIAAVQPSMIRALLDEHDKEIAFLRAVHGIGKA